ncbi:DUF1748-domain-containing protein [Wolfiporia cocos MD-104 SS10]|uniref:DUF1748-domain-containing protein n=1 Tax=Wolfiporia cocos (strain MD-104) TaxID=742152 RepID=A0A2H3JS23_WOLCO|nr:DUF1748-domain-containing protein [Wolfiporia cocos MD-104 SS10]
MFGTLAHLGFDALLITAFLAGIRRTTGLTYVSESPKSECNRNPFSDSPKLADVPNKDVRQILRSYLEFGEYIFDFAVVIFGRSSSFERKRD